MIKPRHYKEERGNKPYDLELMLRLYLLQNLYNLSDGAALKRHKLHAQKRRRGKTL